MCKEVGTPEYRDDRCAIENQGKGDHSINRLYILYQRQSGAESQLGYNNQVQDVTAKDRRIPGLNFVAYGMHTDLLDHAERLRERQEAAGIGLRN
jgi:hypothetical protein